MEEECIHYWVIEIADGPTSKGVCKFCGKEGEFKNWLPFGQNPGDGIPGKGVFEIGEECARCI